MGVQIITNDQQNILRSLPFWLFHRCQIVFAVVVFCIPIRRHLRVGQMLGRWDVVSLSSFPAKSIAIDQQILSCVKFLFRWCKSTRCGTAQAFDDSGILLVVGQIFPFMRIRVQVVEFFAVLPVTDVPPVTIDDCVLGRIHVGKKHVSILSTGWISQGRGQRRSFKFLFRFLKVAHFDERWIHVNQTDRHIGLPVFLDPRASPNERDIGCTFPKRVLAPVSLLAVVIPVVAPQHHNRVICVGAGFKSIQHSPHHGIGITDASEVAVNCIINCI